MTARVAAFTGTQLGMTLDQRAVFALVLRDLCVDELRVGDCIGADAEATRIAQAVGVRTVCHPPDINRKRAFTSGHEAVHSPRPYLARNRDMVDAAEVLIAAPGRSEPSKGRPGGTWWTVRYARSQDVPCVIIPRGARVPTLPGWALGHE